MKAIKKFAALILILVVPVFIYLFLEGFGVNKYSIPRYHTDSTSLTINKCINLKVPHRVNAERHAALGTTGKGAIVVIHPVLDECFDCPPNLNPIKRFVQRHPDVDVVSIYARGMTKVEGTSNNLSDKWFSKEIDFADLISIMRCELLIEMPANTTITALREATQLVLLDGNNVIRGYYPVNSREDIDRLITEVSILKDE